MTDTATYPTFTCRQCPAAIATDKEAQVHILQNEHHIVDSQVAAGEHRVINDVMASKK